MAMEAHDNQDAGRAVCPLCGQCGSLCIGIQQGREFLQCPTCALVFVPAAYHWSAAQQEERYRLHRNDPSDEGYIRHLKRLVNPLLDRLPADGTGLDFGSGPEPVLSLLLQSCGFVMRHYDPFFARDQEALRAVYDFVVISEVAEHFIQPMEDWNLVCGLVPDGGWIGVMTQFAGPDTNWGGWVYANDATHVSFYSLKTWEWIANRFGLKIGFCQDPVILFQVRRG